MADDYYSWADRRNRPEERIREALKKRDLERTQEIPPPDEYGMEVRESRLSDTGRIRMGKLFGSKR